MGSLSAFGTIVMIAGGLPLTRVNAMRVELTFASVQTLCPPPHLIQLLGSSKRAVAARSAAKPSKLDSARHGKMLLR